MKPDYVVALFVSYMPNLFRADDEAIHSAFARLSKVVPGVFGWFDVSSDYPFPFSRTLEKAMQRLLQSELLAFCTSGIYYISSGAQVLIQDMYQKHFTEREIEIIGGAAVDLGLILKIGI